MNLRAYLPLVIGVVILLALCGAYGFAYYELTAWSNQASSLATQAGQENAQLNQAALAHTELDTLATEQSTLDQYIVDKNDVVPFLETLQATGNPLGATVNVLSVSDDTTGGHERIDLSLSITGSFDAVVRTVGAIEYGPYDATVQNLSLDIPTTDGVASGKEWTAALVLSVGARSASSTPTHP